MKSDGADALPPRVRLTWRALLEVAAMVSVTITLVFALRLPSGTDSVVDDVVDVAKRTVRLSTASA